MMNMTINPANACFMFSFFMVKWIVAAAITSGKTIEFLLPRIALGEKIKSSTMNDAKTKKSPRFEMRFLCQNLIMNKENIIIGIVGRKTKNDPHPISDFKGRY